MTDVRQRVAELSPEKRRVLEQLLRQRAAHNDETGGVASASPAAPERQPERGDQTSRVRGFYDELSQQLDGGELGSYSTFLNYGYASNGSAEYAREELPRYSVNKNSAKLALEVLDQVDLTGGRVLDVGCGRGGTIDLIKRCCRAAQVVGLDLSLAALSFCHGRHGAAQVQFMQGNAEQLPFAAESFDAVTNIESSCSYADLHGFYAEVARVLKPGGWFLYTDLMPAALWPRHSAVLQDLAFDIERERDITANVLLSCREIAANRLAALASAGQDSMADFLGVPGSSVHSSMASGEAQYRIFRLKKGARPRHG